MLLLGVKFQDFFIVHLGTKNTIGCPPNSRNDRRPLNVSLSKPPHFGIISMTLSSLVNKL